MFIKKDAFYSIDILLSIAQLENSVKLRGNNIEVIFEDYELQNIAERVFEIIGEASKRLSKTMKEHYSNIPWREVAGMRDVVIHDYNEVNYHIFVSTYNEELGNLKKACEDYLSKCGLSTDDIQGLQYNVKKNIIKPDLIEKLEDLNKNR